VVDVNHSMKAFDPKDYQGTWYVAVHDEPTQPSWCGCDKYMWTLVPDSNPVEYRSSLESSCMGWPTKVTLSGYVSARANRPGEQMEVR
jgi:hypothetical protein